VQRLPTRAEKPVPGSHSYQCERGLIDLAHRAIQQQAKLTAVFGVFVLLIRTVDDVITPAMSFDAHGTSWRGVTRVRSSGTLPQQLGFLPTFNVVRDHTWRTTTEHNYSLYYL